MFDFEGIMNQAKEFQKKMKEDLMKMAVTSSCGGGAVTVVVNGQKEITKIEFKEMALKDPELLADFVLAAVNGAYAQVDQKLQERGPANLGSLDLSAFEGLFKK